ncbi:hypothetical protein H0E87_006684 [Populus deltoides]|uniref:Uncharacterized protein n=1 Tax=Populus deltoides TaxID=3696 RepID=A0A8T2Z7E0_POPDE|nr:hypothetical protein H0E87_006684 [Populus deltoides]
MNLSNTCLDDCDLDDRLYTGPFYHGSTNIANPIFKKLDRVFVNEGFIASGLPILVLCRLFEKIWNSKADWTTMFQVCKNLKMLKPHLKKLNATFYGSITSKVWKAKARLKAVQMALLRHPLPLSIHKEREI